LDPFKTDFVFSPPSVAPFPAKVTVRSERHAKLIEREFLKSQMGMAGGDGVIESAMGVLLWEL
jgi:hypothetical protein